MTLEKQLEIVKEAKALLIADFEAHKYMSGLCYYVNRAGNSSACRDVQLFTYDNALKYANATPDSAKDYWWKVITLHPFLSGRGNMTLDTYDYENRILFLDWMITKYEKMLKPSLWKRILLSQRNIKQC